MAKRAFGLLLWLVLVTAGASAAGQAAPQTVDAVFKDFTTDQAPGCAIGATRAEGVLVAKAFGVADLEHNVPLTPQSVFYVGSVAKQFTALMVLLLERDGKLKLEDRVRAYLPELPDYADKVTVRQLLHHTSGLRDFLTLSEMAGDPADQVITERAMLDTLGRQQQLDFEPGTEHVYSNSGYVLLSMIAHRVSGRPLDELARERIFTPLGMKNTRFQHNHAVPIPGRAIGYVRQGATWLTANGMLDVVGGGGLYTTVDDMMRWAGAFERPEFSELLLRMQQPGRLADGRSIANGYGMGLVQATYRGVPVVVHTGVLAGYRAAFLRLPREKLTVVTLCNNATANAARLSQMVVELYTTEGMSAPASVAVAAAAAPRKAVPKALGQALAGLFYSAELDATYRIVAGADETTLQVGSNTPVLLSLAESDILRTPRGHELKPVRDTRGQITGLTLSAGRVRDIVLMRR